MFRQIITWLGVLMFAFATPYATADLKRVGPVDPATGYPAWYQDSTGLALNLCVPNAAELVTGSCLFLANDLPDPSRVEHFPDNFFDEHFWYNLNTSIPTAAGNAKLVIGLEGAFPVDVIAGTQISFGRVRVVIDVPAPGGTYTITHPYGVETFPNVAPGPRAISFSEDIGINCAIGDFSCALSSRVGPFLRAAATPGGQALPPLVLPGGNTYLADPAIPTAITGSPFSNNMFRVQGPNIGGPGVNTIQTTLFNLMARVHIAPIPSVTVIDRATYTRDSSTAKIDLFASTVPSVGSATPNLSFAGVNVAPTLMMKSGDGRNFYGQVSLSRPGLLPASIVVTNNGDVPPSRFEANLVDEVRVTQADYDIEKQVLVISATSSDALLKPTLQAEGFGPLVGGTRTIQGVAVPPPFVSVVSAAGGRGRMPVVTTTVNAAPGATAQDDSASVAENQSVVIDVLRNDTRAATTAVKLLGVPTNGTATVDPDGTVTYKPALNFFGTDSFTYVLSGPAGTADSNIATVTIDVAMVTIRPTASPDAAAVTLTNPVTAVSLDVLANDSAANGTIDPKTVRITQAPASGSVKVDPATGRIQFTPQAAGTVTFSYAVRDSFSTESAPTLVTVTVTAAATPAIAISKATAQTSTSKGVTSTKWVVDGTATRPSSAQTNSITVYIGRSATGTPLGTASVDPSGAWRLTLTSSRGPDASRTVSVRSTAGGLLQAFPLK